MKGRVYLFLLALSVVPVSIFAADPFDGITLTVSQGAQSEEIALQWTGGEPDFTLFRATSPSGVVDPTHQVGQSSVRRWVDSPPPGTALFYVVTSPCVYNSPEVCNGVDDDCNGVVDEGCRSGLCAGSDYQGCDSNWRSVPIESVPTAGSCGPSCVQEMNTDDGNYLQWIACTNGNNTATEYTNPTDIQFWVTDYASVSDARVTFDMYGAGPDARIALSCVDSAGTTLATLIDGFTLPPASPTPGSAGDPQSPVARYVWDVPPKCFISPRVTIRVTRLGLDCLAVDFVRLAIASDFRREPIASIPSQGTCTAACVSALNSDDGQYLQWIACTNGSNTTTEYDTPTDLHFTVPDHASVTSATLDLDVYASGNDARMLISCLGAGDALQSIYDARVTPLPQANGLYSFNVPLACFASPTVTVRIERYGRDCLAADVVALNVKSFAHRVPIASVSAGGSCNLDGTRCLDQMNADDGNYSPWIACTNGNTSSTEYGTPTDVNFTVLDFVNVTHAALAMDVFASGLDARIQISCVDATGTTLAQILPATLFPQSPQVFGFDVPLACITGPRVTIRISQIGSSCLGADYLRLYTTSPDAPFLTPNGDTIEGYTDRPSVAQGQSIAFKVHTRQPTFSMEFIRFGGNQSTIMLNVPSVKGMSQPIPLNAYRNGAGWITTYTLNVPSTWPSGLYAAGLSDGVSGAWVTFIVKEASPGSSTPLVLLASTNTWTAYNCWGGFSFYNDCKYPGDQSAVNMVSLERPNPVAGSPVGDVGHTANAELHIIRWLENNGYNYSMLTDDDIHSNPNLLKSFRTAIISTHSEYWSSEMYDALESFLNDGGNLLYLSGNGVYWKVTLVNGQLEVHKDGSVHQQTNEQGGLWRDLGRPEAAVLGVHYTGEGWPFSGPFQIATVNHWAFDGTGLAAGDEVGKVGLNLFWYQGAAFTGRGGGASGWEADHSDPQWSPANLVVLARSVVYDDGNNPYPWGEITYYDHPGGGGVFAAGSINFGGSLVENDHLSKIVSNVLHHFGINPGPPGGLRHIVQISAVPTGGSCTNACIPGMNHSDDQYLRWIACANGVNTSTEYTNPTDFLFSVPEPAGALAGAWLTLDTYGSGSDAVESVTCVDRFGAVLATIQGAQNFPIEDPRAGQYPAFSQVDRWEVPAACFTAGPTVDVRVMRSGSNCLSVDYLGLSVVVREENEVAIASIPTAGTCTVDCVSRLNADDDDYVRWLACTNGGNTSTEYANPTDLLFPVPDHASVTGGVFVLDAYASGDDARVGITCLDAAGVPWEILPVTLFSQNAAVYRYAVPMACLSAPTVTVRLTRLGSNCLAVDYARLLTMAP